MTQGKSILLVEDQRVLAQLTSMELNNAGHQVTLASHGLEALTFLNEAEFDLLITDLYMPEMGGIELIQQIKQQKLEIPIIVLSASHKGDVQIMLSELGVEHFVDKPLTDTKIALLLHLVKVL
jgi:CheY-like chemotaxis protein